MKYRDNKRFSELYKNKEEKKELTVETSKCFSCY